MKYLKNLNLTLEEYAFFGAMAGTVVAFISIVITSA